MSVTWVKNAHLDDYAEAQDILIEDGKIALVGPAGTLPGERADEVLDCEGRAVLPGFVEAHLHLDKALLDERMPNLAGNLEGAIKVTGALKSRFTMDDVMERARKVLDMAIAQGTTVIRTQPDVDPIVHTLGVDAMLALRHEYRGLIDLQVVAFPQEGIIKAPGTVDLLEECLRKERTSSVAVRTTSQTSRPARNTSARCSTSPRSTTCRSTCTATSRLTHQIHGMRSSSTSPTSPSSAACRVGSLSAT